MELSQNFLVLVPVVMGLVEAVKRVGMDTRYAGLLAVVLGAVGAYYFVSADMAGIMQGVIAGLTSAGLFSGVRATVK